MAKFPTTSSAEITVATTMKKAYAFLWNVGDEAHRLCVDGLEKCDECGDDTYLFVFEPKSAGPVSIDIRYTSHYEGNGKDRIDFKSVDAEGDNTEVEGHLALSSAGRGKTTIRIEQTIAPETPVPRLVQSLVRSIAESEAAEGVKQYLEKVKAALES